MNTNMLTELLVNQRRIDAMHFPGLKESTHRGYWSMALGEEVGELQGAMLRGYWATNLGSEIGKIQGVLKKMQRNLKRDGTPDEMIAKIGEEAADIMIYLLITADVFDINVETLHLSGIESKDVFELSASLGKLSGNIQWSIYLNFKCVIETTMGLIIAHLIQFGTIFGFDLFETTKQKQEANIKRNYDKNKPR